MEQAVVKQLDSLVKLSELDNKIAALKKQLEKIPVAIAEKREEFRTEERALETAEGELVAMQKEHRQAEGALDGHLEKIRKLNEQTSLVKTNKEYQTLLGEIDVLKGQQDGYEEKILELMEKSGEVEKKIQTARVEVAREKAEFETEEAKLLAEGEALRKEMAGHESSREGILPSIEKANLDTYLRVKSFRGDAVAEVRDELCLGCRVSLPPQQFADVIMKDAIQVCSHCNRILYALTAAENKAEG